MSHTLLTAILTRIGLLLLRIATYLPYSLQLRLGRLLGRTAQTLSRKWRVTASKNIHVAFSDQNEQAQQQLIHKHFESLGIGLIEMANAWWGTDNQLRARVTVEGLKHLDHALEQGNGVILLSAHFTTLEIGGRLLSLFRPLHAMYRKQDNPIFNRAMVDGRNSFLQSIVEKSDLRSMLRLLKENRTIWYAMDQNSSDSSAVFTHFFGIPCSTTAATSKLAQRSGAAVIPFTTERIGPENHYHLTIHPPFENFPGDNPLEDTQHIMDHFEEEIRKVPEQYLWIHRRFKNQPEGLPPFYTE
ncbi:MAG: lipid A biosynthesis acyltransferase [Gammaproteobacteria bacterium]|nr:lipid A biosynthesis acyltransferase [Gammaproteobacteria bacterium]